MSTVRRFFAAVDEAWPDGLDHLTFAVIGSGALMLQEPRFRRLTNDSDVWEATGFARSVSDALERIAGRDSPIHRSLRMYLDIVGAGVPFLPRAPLWHSLPSPLGTTNFDVKVLDVVDVSVSKLIRFAPRDVDDIQEMVDRSRVPHDRFVERFVSAVDELSHDARADQLPLIVDRFHRVERDMMGVMETEIELPSWL